MNRDEIRQRGQSVFSRYHFKQLRPGENDKAFEFSGPGVVILCKELPSNVPGEIRFQILDVLAAENDALEVAKSLLAQPRKDDSYLFAELARIDQRGERISAMDDLKAAFC